MHCLFSPKTLFVLDKKNSLILIVQGEGGGWWSNHIQNVPQLSALVRLVVSTDPESMTAGANSLDLILNTVSANHDLTHYLSLLVSFGWAGFGYSMHSPPLPTGEIWVGVGYGMNP